MGAAQDTSAGNHVNYRQIAAELGISRQTVSVAIRNAPGVSDELRARILKTAKKLGYQPQPAMNALMREMRTHHSRRQVMKMAFLNNWNEPFLESTAEPLRAFYLGALAKAESLGYLVEVHELFRFGEDKRKLNRVLRGSGADGVLVFPAENPAAKLEIDWEHYSCVEIGQALPSVPLALVTPHHTLNIEMICRRLVESGHEKIGFIHEMSVHKRVDGDYLAGYLAEAWAPETRHRFVEPLVTDPITRDVALDYLTRHSCDALLVGPHFDLNWLRGIRSIPGDLSVVSFSLYDADRRAGMSGIDEHWGEVGGVAAEHLARLIQTHTRGIAATREVVMVPGDWVKGSTFKKRL